MANIINANWWQSVCSKAKGSLLEGKYLVWHGNIDRSIKSNWSYNRTSGEILKQKHAYGMLELEDKQFPEINIFWQIGLQNNVIIISRESAVLVRKGA